MNINDLDEFFTFMMSKYDQALETDRERALSRIVRLQEELGELAEQTFCKIGVGRKEKIDSYTQDALEKEFGDVFISLMAFAKVLKIKPDEAIAKTLDKVADRCGYENKHHWKLEK
ncbi:MAG: hypothetical protein N4A44_00290 [Alphaproteobacteria bacterium]|jgi:NTP pyrophosphatase (non-canonical NTP hydrolase)|nr:hypothetical protein [Alphaproteobacteria bacterium]